MTKLGEILLGAKGHHVECPSGQREEVQGEPLQVGGEPHESV